MINLEVLFAESENVFIAWLQMLCIAPTRIHFIAAIFLALNGKEQCFVFLKAIRSNVACILSIVYAFCDYFLSAVRSDSYVDLLPFIGFS